MYLLQCWFNLSDEGVEDAIYDSYAVRKFMGINFFEQDIPDATTLLHFWHLLEDNGIGKLFFNAINRCLERAGWMMRGDTNVDTTWSMENEKITLVFAPPFHFYHYF